MNAALLHTALTGFPPPRMGKVREVYDLGEELLIVATDRISAFDVIMANGIPDKGKVLTQMSGFWFEKLSHLGPNHLLAMDDASIVARVGNHPELFGRSMVARKAKALPVECVVRAYISGSLLKEYKKVGGGVHGLGLPDGLVESSLLPEPIFTPATKAEEGHDENISFAQTCDLLGAETATLIRDRSLEIFTEAAKHAATCGLILADTKFEFGELPSGEVIWIDEALTPDSSRYWEASQYEVGRSQPSFDKQFVRDYLETLDWDKCPPGPELPDDIVAKTRDKYFEAFRRVTGADVKIGQPV